MIIRFLQVAILGALLFAVARTAHAGCTATGSATSASAQVAASNDIPGIEGRHYFLIQNTGTTNPMNVAIGAAATSSDLYLAPGASWVMTAQGLKMVPGGTVNVISAAGTTYSWCDW